MRVTDNVYVLSGSYYGAVNNNAVLGDVYGIRYEGGIILIDSGMNQTGPARIQKTLGEYGITEPVTHVILTHGHHDHAGGGKAFQDAGTKIIIGKEDAPYCEAGGAANLGSPFTEQDFPAYTPDIPIAGDCEMELSGLKFAFYKTPGHTRGSLCALLHIDNKAILFTGDALQPGGGHFDQVSFGWQGDMYFSRADIVDSMKKLSSLNADIILPGHGKICLDNGGDVLRYAYKQALMTMR